VETSEIGRSEVMIQAREPMLIIDQPAGQTTDAKTSNGYCTGRVPRPCYEEQPLPSARTVPIDRGSAASG
jgi:hypothetical protein